MTTYGPGNEQIMITKVWKSIFSTFKKMVMSAVQNETVFEKSTIERRGASPPPPFGRKS